MKKKTLPTIFYFLAITLLLDFAISRVFASTYLGVREFGDPISGAGSRSVAMGSTGLAHGEEAATFRMNPAIGGDLSAKEVSLSFGPAFVTEKVVETSSSTEFRDNALLELNEFTAFLPFADGRAWVGISVAPLYDFHYEGSFSLFSSTGSPLVEIRNKNSGALWAMTPGIGFSLSKNFALGASYDVWMGNEEARIYRFRYGTGFTADLREKADYSGGAAKVGFRWNASDTVSFGGVFQPSSRLTRDFDFVNSTDTTQSRSGKDKWDMPMNWGLGLSYRVGGERATEMAVEVRQTAWSDLKINGKDVNTLAATKLISQETAENAGSVFSVASATPRRYRDVTEVALGVEHELTDQWRLRLGFHHLPYFADKTVEATFFTFGAGYAAPSGRWGWGVAGEFGKRDYKGDNLFFGATQRADETFRRILLSGRWKW